jgi:hypothetical protein
MERLLVSSSRTTRGLMAYSEDLRVRLNRSFQRFFAWIARNRRLAKDFEATIASARAVLHAASIMPLVRRIACASWISRPTLCF